MKIIIDKKIALAFIGIFSWFFASSQTPRDSLTQYLVIAAKNNPTVLQRFYEYKAALQKVPQVGSLADPSLTVGVFIQPMELMDGKEVADLRLMQMFPWFGTLKAAKDEMSLMAKAKFESFRDAKLEVFLDMKRTWNELQKIQQETRFSEQNLGILQTIERLTQVKFQAGSSLADLYRVQIEIGELENNIDLLKSQFTTITARFNAYLNRPLLSPVYLPDQMTTDSLSVSLLSVTDSLLLHSPMLGMLQYEQQALDARKKMVTAMGYPMIGLGVDYTVINKSESSTSSMNGKDMIMPMVTLTLPIYRKKYNAMRSETELLKTANKENYQASSNSLQSEYYEALQLFKDGERRMKLYGRQSDLAEKTMDILLKGFSTSGTPLTDILRIRQQTLDYELKKTEAVADYNTAIAWLQRLMAFSPIQ